MAEEAAGQAPGAHLAAALSAEEAASLPRALADKLERYIDTQFEQYLVARALHDSTRGSLNDKIKELENTVVELTSQYDEAKLRLVAAETTTTELERQVHDLNAELEKAHDKITRMENELVSMKSSRDAAVDERNDLTRILERRDAEIKRLSANEASLLSQLQAAVDAKCEALALNDEVKSKELSFEYREKRMNQERTLLNSQIAGLTEEVNRLTSELQTARLNNTSRLITLESQLAEKVEELTSTNNTITHLNELKHELETHLEKLAEKCRDEKEIYDQMAEGYRKELQLKTDLAELSNKAKEEAESKTTELREATAQLQQLLNDMSEKGGELETKMKQMESDHEELIKSKEDVISSLKNELENINELLRVANTHNLDKALADLAPTAVATSKLIKSGMSFTEVYSELVTKSEELSKEKEENRRLNYTINTIVRELEERAPALAKQKAEYDEVIESNMAMTQQVDSLVSECNRLRDDYAEATKVANHYNRENNRLKGELQDLSRQVCFLLKEIEQSRGGIANGEHDSSNTASNTSSDSSRLGKTLVTFSDIQELQTNNQKLLRMVRELTEKQEECERHREQIESGEIQSKLEALKNRETELTEAMERQTKMLNGLIKQRDMFKTLYHEHVKGKRAEGLADNNDSAGDASVPMETSSMNDSGSKAKPVPEVSNLEIKLKETEKHLEHLKEEYKTYKEEKVTNERMLYEQIEGMRKEISKLTASNSKSSTTAEYYNDRLKILQTNINTYRKQISSLEDKNKVFSSTIAKHEVSLQHLRDEALSAQSKLATAEVTVDNLRMECKLLKDVESRLLTERDALNRERQGQALLLKNLEMIKASLERVEMEGRQRLESRLDEATRECAALRRRLQEEQDRFRELAAHLERQTQTAKSRMQEEKDAADAMRTEIAQLRQDFTERSKSHEELAKKLKMALTPNKADGTFDYLKKIKDLENQLQDKAQEIKSLQDQISVSKEHIKQYCDISECSEKQLKALTDEYSFYKSETQAKLQEYEKKIQYLQERCSELEAELSLQTNGQTSGSFISKSDQAMAEEELRTAQTNFEACRVELESARAEISRLSETVQTAEDKYAHEMVLHSADIQTLTRVKEEVSQLHQQLNEIKALKDQTVEKLESEKMSWLEREKMLTAEKIELQTRLEDLNKQNSVLHDQIGALGTQLSVVHASQKSMSESMNESGAESSMNISINEDDNRSSDQLCQIIKFLRKEKDIAVAKFDILQAETARLKSQLEITSKKLDETKLTLGSEREKSEVSMVTVAKQSDILRKVETLNALTDSNRVLREERDSLLQHVEEITARTKALEEQMNPLQEKISDLTSKNDTFQAENTALRADSARWRTRVNALVERANKTSPEDWKRLQNERETLAKMLTNEKETVKKLNEELVVLRTEKSKIEESFSNLSRQHSNLMDEHKKQTEELQTLRNDVARITDELTKTKTELCQCMDNNSKINEEMSSKEAALQEIRNKELQIRKIAKKYKAQYEELTKTAEEEKKKKEGDIAANEAAASESLRKAEERLTDLEARLAAEKAENDKLKSELESLQATSVDKDEKSKQVLKHAKTKIMELTEQKNNLNRELTESRSKIEAIEQSNRDEAEVRVSAIKSQYEGRMARLDKEWNETQAEKTREIEALVQKVNLLQRQLASQSSSSKQQPTTEKATTDPPTANIKPMAGVAQQSVSGIRRGGETPLASIRPMAQVGPTAPHDAHSTEYMPASSSRPLPRAAVAASPASSATAATTAPPESTQDMDVSEAGVVSAGASDTTAQTSSSHSQPPQQVVALVMPRIEQPGGSSSATSASSAGVASVSASVTASAASSVTPSVSANVSAAVSTGQSGVSVSACAETGATPQPSNGGSGSVSTSHAAPTEARPIKRPRAPQRPAHPTKRPRVQGFERSVDIEYQVPTSSRCDQDDENVIVVDSEEDEDRCTGTTYQENENYAEEEEEEVEEEQEVEGGEEEDEDEEDAADDDDESPEQGRQESPAQSSEAGEAEETGEAGEVESAETAEAGPAAPHQQIEQISSGTEPSGALSLAGTGAEEADDSIVPSTPTLYVPRRNDGFGEAVVSPVGGPNAARFTFAEAGAASHHDTHADLAASLPPPPPLNPAQPSPRAERSGAAGGEEWGEARDADEEAAAVSSQGSQPPSPHQAPEEGREAEASASPTRGGASRRRPYHRPSPAQLHHRGWAADADMRGGGRPRTPRGRRGGRPSNSFVRY